MDEFGPLSGDGAEYDGPEYEGAEYDGADYDGDTLDETAADPLGGDAYDSEPIDDLGSDAETTDPGAGPSLEQDTVDTDDLPPGETAETAETADDAEAATPVWDQPPAVGTDPDVPVDTYDQADGGDDFPPTLDHVALPEPVDGPPWVDPGLLGDTGETGPTDGTDAAADPFGGLTDRTVLAGDLAALDALDPSAAGSDPTNTWTTLRGSDDPAVRALAGYWGP